jgi:hypothetical protein
MAWLRAWPGLKKRSAWPPLVTGTGQELVKSAALGVSSLRAGEVNRSEWWWRVQLKLNNADATLSINSQFSVKATP